MKTWKKILIVAVFLIVIGLTAYVFTLTRAVKNLSFRVVSFEKGNVRPEEVKGELVVEVTNPGGISIPKAFVNVEIKNPLGGMPLMRAQNVKTPVLKRKATTKMNIPIRINWVEIAADTAINVLTNIIGGKSFKEAVQEKVVNNGFDIVLYIRPWGIPWTVKKVINFKPGS